ncbi:HAD-superfamily hydrolase, subfamily IIB [Planctopirus limnophila DSM 3776]|uniref:sucrose-phosphate synthase n=2 Tax=Planctopirus limnophila TaxID=120 RepID=D5SVY5_PLAL2|nr:HAD-superfamily hydrolase, subfamily IIB [Planctopirus limnophila DSM 3776]
MANQRSLVWGVLMYVQILSLHGLVRGDSIEMGRDADTGGQVRYVLDLAVALAEDPRITQVDLITRRLRGLATDGQPLDESYSREIEPLSPRCRIVRISCTDDQYVRKEDLWPYLDEFTKSLEAFTRQQPWPLAWIHGHYADAGVVARNLARQLQVPFLFTGHSLGKPKLDYLASEGWSHEKANRLLHIDHRISEEQSCLNAADAVITSTLHEKLSQYQGYQIPEETIVEVIAPGLDLKRFFPYYNYELPGEEIGEGFKQARSRMQRQLARFLADPQKKLILALCRPDRRKNIQSLIQAYGESPELRAIANLAVFAGIREDINTMSGNEREVLTDILLLMDRYDLYGKMAIPKRHDSELDVPELYRLAASGRGVFVNSAFIELFGLTTIEASATGLPFIATENGGPQDIVALCNSGIVLDVTDQQALTAGILRLLTDGDLWNEYSNNGIQNVRSHYAWKAHIEHYLRVISRIHPGWNSISDSLSSSATLNLPSQSDHPSGRTAINRSSLMEKLDQRLENVSGLLITDIDGTLLGDRESLQELLDWMEAQQGQWMLGVATGRAPALVYEVCREWNVPYPEIMIASVGSEIVLGDQHEHWPEWSDWLGESWHPSKIAELISRTGWLVPQTEPHSQRPFKLSYLTTRTLSAEQELFLKEHLFAAGCPCQVIASHGQYVDILPERSGKGAALDFLMSQISRSDLQIVVAGDSCNDWDLLKRPYSAIAVGNSEPLLKERIRQEQADVYLAQRHFAAGILEGLSYLGLR